MEDFDHMRNWCRARKIFPVSEIQADEFLSAAKIDTLGDHVPRSNIRKGKQRMDLVQNSIPEVNYVKNGKSSKSPILVMVDHEPSSGTKPDTMPDHPHGDSGPPDQFLPPLMSFAGENSDEGLIVGQKIKPFILRVKLRGQKVAPKESGLSSHERMKDNLDQYTPWNRETSMEASLPCSISKVVVENMQLRSRRINREIRNLRTVATNDTRSSYSNRPCHSPASKEPKRNQSLISEAKLHLLADVSALVRENEQLRSRRINREIRNLRTVATNDTRSSYSNRPCHSPASKEPKRNQSLISDAKLHLLADVSALVGENEQATLPDNIRVENDTRKATFTPTGVSFLQKRRIRRAKSVFKHPEESDAPKMPHNLKGNLSVANAKPLLTNANISMLGNPVCTEHSERQAIGDGDNEDQTTIPQFCRSKRTRAQVLPSKYCDSVMQPWKKGTRM